MPPFGRVPETERNDRFGTPKPPLKRPTGWNFQGWPTLKDFGMEGLYTKGWNFQGMPGMEPAQKPRQPVSPLQHETPYGRAPGPGYDPETARIGVDNRMAAERQRKILAGDAGARAESVSGYEAPPLPVDIQTQRGIANRNLAQSKLVGSTPASGRWSGYGAPDVTGELMGPQAAYNRRHTESPLATANRGYNTTAPIPFQGKETMIGPDGQIMERPSSPLSGIPLRDTTDGPGRFSHLAGTNTQGGVVIPTEGMNPLTAGKYEAGVAVPGMDAVPFRTASGGIGLRGSNPLTSEMIADRGRRRAAMREKLHGKRLSGEQRAANRRAYFGGRRAGAMGSKLTSPAASTDPFAPSAAKTGGELDTYFVDEEGKPVTGIQSIMERIDSLISSGVISEESLPSIYKRLLASGQISEAEVEKLTRTGPGSYAAGGRGQEFADWLGTLWGRSPYADDWLTPFGGNNLKHANRARAMLGMPPFKVE